MTQVKNLRYWILRLAKWYIKRIPRENRYLRLEFIGVRRQEKINRLLNNHHN